MGEKTRVLLVDYYAVIRAGLAAILQDLGYEVVGTAEGEEDIQEKVERLRPDVVLTDIGTDKMDGLEVVRRAKAAGPETAVIILTTQDSGAYILDTINAGASGYLPLRDLTPPMLGETIRMARNSSTVVRTELFRNIVAALRKTAIHQLTVLRGGGSFSLTEREAEVLALIASGESNRVIASTLGIQTDTAKKYVKSVISKIGARNRTHAAILAGQAGLVFRPPVLSLGPETDGDRPRTPN